MIIHMIWKGKIVDCQQYACDNNSKYNRGLILEFGFSWTEWVLKGNEGIIEKGRHRVVAADSIAQEKQQTHTHIHTKLLE